MKVTEITIEVTDKCPLRCVICSTRNSPLYENSEILSIDELIKKALDIVNSNLRTLYRIRFSGGEPLLALEEEHITPFTNCLNVREIIVNTSGYLGIKMLPSVKYRFSLYGNKQQHEGITLTEGSYDKLIESLESALYHGYDVDLTTPIFDKEYLTNVIEVAKKHDLWIRIAREIYYGEFPLIKYDDNMLMQLSIKSHRDVAIWGKSVYPKINITCSLFGKCNELCDYPKISILANGKIIGCAIEKRGY